MHRRMTERIDALPVDGSARDTLYAVAEQEAVVWSHFQLAGRADPDLLREHRVNHASWVRRLTGLVRAACPVVMTVGGLETRVRGLVACLDGLALNAVTDPDDYPPDLQRRVLSTQLDLILTVHEASPGAAFEGNAAR